MRSSRAGSKRGRAGEHERPHRGRRLRDRNRVALALADSQGDGDLIGDLQRVSLGPIPARHWIGREIGKLSSCSFLVAASKWSGTPLKKL